MGYFGIGFIAFGIVNILREIGVSCDSAIFWNIVIPITCGLIIIKNDKDDYDG